MSDSKSAPLQSQTGVERVLIAIWSQALGVQSVGNRDNFFDLGGDISLARRLVEQIRTYLGIEIPSDAIIENPTVKGLADLLESVGRHALKNAISPDSHKTEYHASFAQVRLWSLDKLQPGSPAYNLCDVYRLHGRLEREVLAQALLSLVRRHESLRTIFCEQKGDLLQRVVEPYIESAYETLEHYYGPEQEIRLHQLVEAERQRSFSLEVGPLCRFLLIALSSELHVLVLTAHHIITDGWSQQVMISDLSHFYHAISKGITPALPKMKLQYGNFAEWQREWLSGAEWERQSIYWKEQLAGAPSVLALPTERPRGEVEDSSPARIYSFTLGKELSSRLRSLSLANGTTLFMTLLAGFQILLSRYCWQDDICIGSPTANRSRKETEDLIGFFVSTLILRSNIENNPSFLTFLNRTRDLVLEALDHADMPFDQIMNMLRPEDISESSHFVQVIFTLQNIPRRSPSDGELIFEHLPVATVTSKFDLGLTLEETTGEWQEIAGYFSFNSQIFEQVAIERMARCYITLLNAAADDARCPVFQLKILGDQERKLVMEEWNQSVAFHSSEASRSSGAHDVAIAANEDIIALLDEPTDIPGPEKSISHCRGYILDRYLQPVPPGAAGVLYLAIETIALNDAHKSTKLIENPFGPGTLYSTNKLVHNLNNGRIAVIGKADEWTNARNQKMMAKSKGSGDGSAPRAAIEQALVKIWREVLRIEYVGIYDNFFELGGNSLLAIRVAAEAGHYGLHFIGRDLFRYQVIADLVTVVRLVEPDVAYRSMETRDWWPTLPNQRSYFDRNVVNPALWNVVILRKVASAANPRLLQLAIEQLIRKHSTLRLQFREFEGEWVQYLADESQSGLFYTFDLSHFDYATQLKELLRIGNQLNSSFRFNEGTLVRFALFHLGEQGIRFLIVVHHLICDAISAKILLRDLSLIYTRLNIASQPEEYTHNRPFLEWALLVHSQPAMAQAIAEQPYWAPRKTVSIPVDFPKGKNLVATADRVHIELSEAESAALIMQAQKRYQTSIDILLLWALATCMMEWQKQQFVVVTMITHGRECQWSHIDLSDAVGFFAMHYPLVLEIPSDIGLEAGVALVRTQFEAVPNEGLGHGMLRFIHNHKYVNQRIPLQEEGDISFNYLGDNDAPYNQSEIFTVAQEDTGSRLDPRAEGPYKLGLFSYISGGRIQGNWWFNLGIYKPQTIEALTVAFQQNLRRLL